MSAYPASCQRRGRRAALQEILHDRRPGLRQVSAVVAATAEGQYAAVTQALRERLQVARGTPVSLRREAQVSDGIALETVGTTLENDEFRLVLGQVREHPRPDGGEYLIVRARRQRHVQLHSGGCA